MHAVVLHQAATGQPAQHASRLGELLRQRDGRTAALDATEHHDTGHHRFDGTLPYLWIRSLAGCYRLDVLWLHLLQLFGPIFDQ